LFFLYFIRHESSVSKATVCMTGSVVHSRYFIHRQTLERLSDLSPKCGDTNAITNAVNWKQINGSCITRAVFWNGVLEWCSGK